MKNELLENIQKLEERYLPIKEVLESSEEYKKLYKGIISIQSNIIANPDVLFIGINPGEGAYKQHKKEKNTNKPFPEKLTISDNARESIELDWLKKGNARGHFVDKKWFGYDWTERNKPVNNVFPARMVDLLYAMGENRSATKCDVKSEAFINSLKTDVIPKIMYTNINPIATKSTEELGKVISLLSKESSLKDHWSHEKKSKMTKQVVNNFFRQRTFDLIHLLNPKVIVCMGNTAFSELTYEGLPKGEKVNTSEYENRGKKFTMITFTRQVNWSPLIKEVAKEVAEKLRG